MRLRLDKLVLSAGLALAMVATSIPAIAGTPTTSTQESEGLSLNGSTVTLVTDAITESATANTSTLAFATAVTGLSLGGDAEAKTGLTGKVTSVKVTEKNAGEVDVASNTLKSKVKDDGYDVSEQTAQKTKTYEVEVTSTYSYKKNVDMSTEVTTAIAALENDGTDDQKLAAGKNAITSQAANGKLSAADLAVINDGVTTDSSDKDFDYGTKKTTAGENVTSGELQSLNSIKTLEALKAAATSIEVTLSKTATTKYTLTKLPAGYTYDILFNAAATGKEYKVYKEDKTNTEHIVASPVESSIVNDGGKVKVSVSDVNSAMTYFLGEKTVSATDNLLFAPTEGNDKDGAEVVSGDYTAKITNGSQTVIDLTKVADLPEDVKSAGKFEINVKKDGTNVANGPEMTFKIAIPKDVQPTSADKKINWIIVRGHNYDDGNGVVYEIIPSTVEGDYIVFSSDKFSTYALLYTEVAADAAEDPTEEPTTAAPAQEDTQAATAATEAADSTADSSTTSTTASKKTGDNSMMPLFMTTLLLALCAGSLAIYKEKKTN